MKRLDTRGVRLSPDEILAFSCVRDEARRLPWFLEYHRRAGVDRFFIVDNGSRDGTTDYLLGQPDVVLYYTEESFGECRGGLSWLNELRERFAVDHWVLSLDADELLVYPGCERVRLQRLTRYLQSEAADALETLLLDMYSDRPIARTSYAPGESFLSACEFFDADSYSHSSSHAVAVRGGPRERVFWDGKTWEYPAPFLRKVPLVKWRAGRVYEASTHQISSIRPAQLTGALLHFKFFDDFPARVALEVERKQYFDDAKQYVAYLDGLVDDPELTLHYGSSVRYVDSLQLVSLDILCQPDSYRVVLESAG